MVCRALGIRPRGVFAASIHVQRFPTSNPATTCSIDNLAHKTLSDFTRKSNSNHVNNWKHGQILTFRRKMEENIVRKIFNFSNSHRTFFYREDLSLALKQHTSVSSMRASERHPSPCLTLSRKPTSLPRTLISGPSLTAAGRHLCLASKQIK